MTHTISTFEDFKALEGQEIGVSEWFDVTQEQINQFADATNVFGLVQSQSSFPRPKAKHPICNAEVALLTATQYFAPQ